MSTWQENLKSALTEAQAARPAIEGARFDVHAAVAAVAFFPTYLRLTKAEWAGKPFWLEPWQASIVARFFGWKRPDGTRVYRRLALWVARKNGKTELLAGVSLLALRIDNEQGGEGYSIARDKDQASIVFAKMVEMIALMPKALRDEFDTFKTSIVLSKLSASFKPLSGRAAGKHGLSMSVLAGDEIHEWPDDELYTFVHQSTAARRQPCEFLASTAGKRGTYGEEFYSQCLEVLADPTLDPELLVVIHAADPDDDWQDEAVWQKPNPNLGVSVKTDYLRSEARKARLLPRLENDFRRYHLNQWVAQEVRWLPIDAWRACTAEPDNPDLWKDLPARLAGRRVSGGLDLAQVSDFNAHVWVAEPESPGDRWLWVPRFWICEKSLERYADRDREKIERWARDGAITITAGSAADYDRIEADILRDMRDLNLTDVSGIAVDRFMANQLAQHLLDAGLPAAFFGQGFVSMSPPMKEIERAMLRGEIEHGSHPVLDWMAGQIQVKTDDAQNIKPSRKDRSQKIDGMVAGIMATGLAIGIDKDVEHLITSDQVIKDGALF